MLIHTIKEIEAHELATSGKKTIEINSFMDANLLIIFLLTERVMSLIDLLDLLKQREVLKKRGGVGGGGEDFLENSNSQILKEAGRVKLPIGKYFLAFILVGTFADYFYLVILDFKQVQTVIAKKQAIELFCENMVFFDISNSVLQYQYIKNGHVDIFVFISMTFSCINCCYILYRSYVLRSRESHLFMPKEDQRFKEFSLETKIFISNPFKISFLKIYSHDIEDHEMLFKQRYQLENQLKKDLLECSDAKLTKEVSKYMKIGQVTENLKVHEKILTLVILIPTVVGFVLLDMMHAWTEGAFNIYFTIKASAWLCLPQYIIYVMLNFKYQYKEYGIVKVIKQLVIEILRFPVVIFLYVLLFFTPIKFEEIPFIPKTRETWITNFFSSMYFIAIRTLYQIYCINVIYPFVYTGEGIAHKDFTKEEMHNITNEDSLFRIFFYIGVGCFIFTSVINILHLIEIFYRNYLKTHKNVNDVQYLKKNVKNYLNNLQNFRTKVQSTHTNKIQNSHICEIQIHNQEKIDPISLNNIHDTSNQLVPNQNQKDQLYTQNTQFPSFTNENNITHFNNIEITTKNTDSDIISKSKKFNNEKQSTRNNLNSSLDLSGFYSQIQEPYANYTHSYQRKPNISVTYKERSQISQNSFYRDKLQTSPIPMEDSKFDDNNTDASIQSPQIVPVRNRLSQLSNSPSQEFRIPRSFTDMLKS